MRRGVRTLFVVALFTAASAVAAVAVEASAAPTTALVHAEGTYSGHGAFEGETFTLTLYPGHHHMGTFTDTRGERGIWGTSGNGASGEGLTLATDDRSGGCQRDRAVDVAYWNAQYRTETWHVLLGVRTDVGLCLDDEDVVVTTQVATRRSSGDARVSVDMSALATEFADHRLCAADSLAAHCADETLGVGNCDGQRRVGLAQNRSANVFAEVDAHPARNWCRT